MCIFSGSVDRVNKTRIFGRLDESGVQYLVYQMEFSADNELAMILPFPAVPGTEAEFINLEGVPGFFGQLDKAFPRDTNNRRTRGMRSFSAKSAAPLKVHNVGAFEGSFVPTINDLDRLDKRFQFPAGTLGAMERLYQDFSFAVFKLKPGRNQKVHPMAFKFHSRYDDRIFYPTVHIHDGTFPEVERFDHAIYSQVPASKTAAEVEAAKTSSLDEVSHCKLTDLVPASKCCGVLSEDYGFKMEVRGRHANQDVYFTVA